MDRKGLVSTLVNIVIAVILLLASVRLGAQVAKPLLNSEKRSVSYENYKILSDKLIDMNNSAEQAVSDLMIFELHPGYTVVAYDYDRNSLKFCINPNFNPTEYAKPDECKKNEGCLCLYKGEPKELKDYKGKDPNLIECINLGKAKFYSESEGSTTPGSMGCEKTKQDYPPILTIQNFKSKYEDLYLPGSHTIWTWGTQDLYLERQKGSNDINYYYVTIVDGKTLLREKLIHKCPNTDGTYEKCVGQPYDYVFQEEIDMQGNTASFVCKYEKAYDICSIEEIQDCPNGKINDECNCGGMAFDFGYCTGEHFSPEEYGADYCLSNKISDDCKDYKDIFSCTFDVCNIPEKCVPHYDTQTHLYTGCIECPSNCACSNYVTEDLKRTDPCDCDHDGKNPGQENICYTCSGKQIRSCEDYNNYPDALLSCEQDPCGVITNANTGPNTGTACVVKNNRCATI